MTIQATLQHSWQQHWKLRKRRPEPLWARAFINTGLGLLIAAALSLLTATFQGRALDLGWVRHMWLPSSFLCVCICWTSGALFRCAELLLPQSRLDRLNGRPNLGTGLFFIAIVLASLVLGMAIGLQLLGLLTRQSVSPSGIGGSQSIGQMLLITVLGSLLGGAWATDRWRRQQLQLRATEAQLKLLQAQIEPHFLFNTLANVRSLIDCEPQRAGEMLDLFTQHLRGSLGAMRAELLPLERELELVQQYLRLMQLRMCERLEYDIDASPAARACSVPPLLLQPLVENAIRHGLENQVEGGRISVHAVVWQGQLQLTVRDDGCGLDAPRRHDHRKGHGVALANIRERLSSRYGDSATLTLRPADLRGTEASIEIPLSTQP